MKSLGDSGLDSIVPPRTYATFDRARNHSDDVLAKVKHVATDFLQEEGVDAQKVCITIVGSIGRKEALAASDVDLLPVTTAPGVLTSEQDQRLRDAVRKLGFDVSKGEDLTRHCSIQDVTDVTSIGAESDDGSALTRRMLLLTESAGAGGDFCIEDVRRQILEAYATNDTTSGRHILSLCNDLARYYRTLCIEYKGKVDATAKTWCARNAKLRHSRKFWYFCSIASMLAAASDSQTENTFQSLLDLFAKPPVDRLAESTKVIGGAVEVLGELLESYAWFLNFMSEPKHRQALENISHDSRYENALSNPFPAVKFNSDVLNFQMMAFLESLPRAQRMRALKWFFF